MTQDDREQDQSTVEMRPPGSTEDRLAAVITILRAYLGPAEYYIGPCHRRIYPEPGPEPGSEPGPEPGPARTEYGGAEDPMIWLDATHC